MKSFCFAAAFAVLAAGCTSTSPQAGNGASSLRSAGTDSYILHTPEPASRPPRLSVGTTYPDTQLILPWFLNDIIDFVNYR